MQGNCRRVIRVCLTILKRVVCALSFTILLPLTSSTGIRAQDLAPRAYVITPLHSNAITISWSGYKGGIDFNGAVPIKNATGTFSVPIISYYRSFNLLGRSANIAAFLPYGVGHFRGDVQGAERRVYRSGLVDSGFRLSVNLKGGPAMSLPEFRKWRQKSLLGVSLRVIAPTGQYAANRLINWSINRWAFNLKLVIRDAEAIGS